MTERLLSLVPVPIPMMPSIPVAMSPSWMELVLVMIVMIVMAYMVVMVIMRMIIQTTTDRSKLFICQFNFYVIIDHLLVYSLLLLKRYFIDVVSPLAHEQNTH